MTASFKARCDLAVKCLPNSTYKDMVRQLHKEMLQHMATGIDKDTLRDMAGSAFEEAMAFGISTDSFERLARTVNKRAIEAGCDGNT